MIGKPWVLFVLLCCAVPLFAAAPSLTQTSWLCENCGWAVADVNGDGLDDVVDATRHEVRFNLGGAFGSPVAMTGIADKEYIHSMQDYNGDGLADLVLWPVRGPHDEGPNRFAFGNGNGTFRPAAFPERYGALGQQPPRDFNRDGKTDLVLVNWTLQPGQRYIETLSFLRGNGDGSFALDQDLTFPGTAYPYMAIADFNGDGQWDVVRTGYDHEMLYFHFSEGKSGRLGPARERFVGTGVSRVQAGDVNGDGLADLVVETEDPSNAGMVLLYGDGKGRFPSFSEMPAKNSAWGAIVADIFPGGGDEISLPHRNGDLTVYSATGNQLHAVASTHLDATYYSILPMHFRSASSFDFMVNVRDFTANIGRSMFVLADGELPETASVQVPGTRRARAANRGSSVSAYAATVTGECVPPSLDAWSFTREGIFLDFEPEADGTQILGAMVGDKLSSRVIAGSRVMSGRLKLTPDELRGYLYDRTQNTCGGTGRVLVDGARMR